MITLQIEGGRRVNRIFAGVIKDDKDLVKFVTEVAKELHEGKPTFVEIWAYDGWLQSHKPTEEQELLATVGG